MPEWIVYITIVLAASAGSAMCVWIGELISEKGVGNGISLLIFTGIASQVVPSAIEYVELMIIGYSSWWFLPVVLVLIFAVILGLTLLDLGGAPGCPCSTASAWWAARCMAATPPTFPCASTRTASCPLIFASTLMQFPAMIAQFWPNSGFYNWYTKWLGTGTVIYMIVYFLLIIGFTYFYSSIAFNPNRRSARTCSPTAASSPASARAGRLLITCTGSPCA